MPEASASMEYSVCPLLVLVSGPSIVPFPLASSNMAPLTLRQFTTERPVEADDVQEFTPVKTTVYVPFMLLAALVRENAPDVEENAAGPLHEYVSGPPPVAMALIVAVVPEHTGLVAVTVAVGEGLTVTVKV